MKGKRKKGGADVGKKSPTRKERPASSARGAESMGEKRRPWKEPTLIRRSHAKLKRGADHCGRGRGPLPQEPARISGSPKGQKKEGQFPERASGRVHRAATLKKNPGQREGPTLRAGAGSSPRGEKRPAIRKGEKDRFHAWPSE